MSTIVTRAGKGSPLTNAEVDANFTNLNAAVQPSGGTAGQVLSKTDATDYNSQWIDNYSTAIQVAVKAGVALTKGQAVYITGASGANIIVGLAQANAEATSSKTFGLINATLATNGFGSVVCEGPISGIDTSTATEGDAVWLSPTTPGGIVFGLANKPSAPNHMVYLGVVSRAHATQGQIQVKVQNGFELEELHNVAIASVADAQVLQYEAATTLWKNKTLLTTDVTEGTNLYYTNARARAAVSGSAPLSYNSTTGAFTIAQATTSTDGYLSSTDWNTFNGKQAAFGSQTANYFYAAPSAAAGSPTFRAIVAADIPTLNQNTTGSSGSCTGNAATATTATTANALNTANNYQGNSLGVGTAASGTAGEIRATNNVTAYYSDGRLKTKVRDIVDPLAIVRQIKTMVYHANELAVSYGYDASILEVGVDAGSVKAVYPEATAPAPFDIGQHEDGTEYSLSGQNYLTVRYERLTPLLLEAAKVLESSLVEQDKRIVRLEALVAKLIEG